MYIQQKPTKSQIKANELKIGEPIESKMQRILNNNEPITDGAPIIYTERKDGVQAEYNVRTDRYELAVEAMTNQAKANLAKRKEILEKKEETTENPAEPKP